MILIVGLGNPGKKYARTRHNVGFMMADKIREEWSLPNFELNKKFKSEVSEGTRMIHNTRYKILLAKPMTFMNNSGQAVKKIMKFYKLKPLDIIIIHDDLDIDLGKCKISAGSSAAGHNGVQSIIDALGTKRFTRTRIGIEGTVKRKTRQIAGDKFVLKNFTYSENKVIQKVSGEIISSFQKMLK